MGAAFWGDQRRLAANMIVAWLLETLGIWLPCLIANQVPDPGFNPSFFALFRYFVVVGTIVIEGDIVCAHLIINKVYARVPRYKAGGPAPVATWGSIAREFAVTMAPSLLFGAAATAFGLTQLVALERADFDRIVALSARPVFPDQATHLLARLALVRLAVDVAFYLFHYALHTKLLFGPLHRRHHEHRSPHVWTNYHFTAVDLFVEGFAPFGVGLAVLELVGLRCSRLEYLLLLSHIMWYEIGSHAGKPVPVVSYFPPFSLAYNFVWRVVWGAPSPDADNVWSVGFLAEQSTLFLVLARTRYISSQQQAMDAHACFRCSLDTGSTTAITCFTRAIMASRRGWTRRWARSKCRRCA